jgi:hypothetical protein
MVRHVGMVMEMLMLLASVEGEMHRRVRAKKYLTTPACSTIYEGTAVSAGSQFSPSPLHAGKTRRRTRRRSGLLDGGRRSRCWCVEVALSCLIHCVMLSRYTYITGCCNADCGLAATCCASVPRGNASISLDFPDVWTALLPYAGRDIGRIMSLTVQSLSARERGLKIV